MVAVDVRSGKPEEVKLIMHGAPTSNWSFHPHGIFYSSRSQRIYTVNHSGESRAGTRVEVFSVKENAKGLPEVSAGLDAVTRSALVADVHRLQGLLKSSDMAALGLGAASFLAPACVLE